ncbi:MAG: 2-oxo acid dehydrogenase subunit E2 [Planctomycetes bacterium]|nr:2-oxo acid dehydrogenase subunit E2 [Planctomycetota bacterium]
MQRAIAAHMVKSALQLAPHVTAVHEVDLSQVVAHRERNKDSLVGGGVRLTYSAYFVFAAARALAEVPTVNSRWHDDALEVFSDANIGMVTAIEHGLMVPVVRRAQTLDLAEIARALHELTDKARHGRLTAHETRGSTFAITNHGMGGSILATPIIHQPHAAILGIGKLQKRAMVVEEGGVDQIRIRPMIFATLTIDHRVLDASSANAYMCRFGAILQDPGAWS